MGDQLLGVLIAAHKVVLDELNQPVGVAVRLKLEIQAVSRLLDSDRLLVSLVLENHLLQEQESALVMNPLAHLHLTDPVVWRPCLLAIVTLFVLHNKFHSECLLKLCVILDLLLYDELEFDPARVRLRPH